jgi:MFS family permease
MGIACIWLGVASKKSYISLLLGRAFLGVFEAPIESIVPSTVTDIFFLHDRGSKVSMYGLSVLGGNELGPVLSAFMIQALGMDWAYYIVAIFIGINFLTIIFFMPETRFTGTRPSIVLDAPESMGEKQRAHHVEVNEDEEHLAPRKRTYVQDLAFWGRPDPDISLLRAFLRPFVLLAYPTIVWACFIYGMALSWNVLLAVLTGQLFAPP